MTSYIGNLKVYTHTHELINDVRRIIEYKINIQKLRMNLGTMNNPIRKLRKKNFLQGMWGQHHGSTGKGICYQA